MINIKFINATSVQLKNQAGITVQNMGEFISPTEFYYSGNTFSKDPVNFYHFEIIGNNVQLSGTIGDVTEAYQYWNLFKGQTAITDASNLTLSSATTKKFCYANMFMDCTNLVNPPTISATTLDQWCYSSMFAGCVSLTSAPALIATTLASNCYFAMFYNCKSLSSAQLLPATTLADWCYGSMFFNCQNLTSLSTKFTDWNTNGNSTKHWVTYIDTVGTFYNDTIQEIHSYDEIPQKWELDYLFPPLSFKSTGNTSIKIDKENLSYRKNKNEWTPYTANSIITCNDGDVIRLSGTNSTICTSFVTSGNGTLKVYGNPQSLISGGSLTSSCFKNLFFGCNNIVDASELLLSSTELSPNCYEGMFARCTNLTSVPNLPATTLADYCYSNMFQYCSNLATVPSDLLPATGLAKWCYEGMFDFCSSLSTAPQLPATTLAQSCYSYMFRNCDALSDAPLLPATTLVKLCYNYMFDDCNKLSSVNVNFTQWNDSIYATTNWLHIVAANGTFICPTALDTTTRNSSHVPQNWTVVNK